MISIKLQKNAPSLDIIGEYLIRPHTSAGFQTPDQAGKTGENRLTILSTCNIM